MAQENNVMTLSSLRNDRTFATICQFFHTFQSAFRPWPNYSDTQWISLLNRPRNKNDAVQDDYVFSTEDLEDMLIDTSRRYQLEELIIRMLKLLTRNRFISSTTWQDYFSREWDRREPDQVNPFYIIDEQKQQQQPSNQLTETSTNDQTDGIVTQNESIATNPQRSFFDLPMETRLVLLNTLCEWQLDDPERLREHLNDDLDASQWRVDPIGYDKKGNTFWLFDDNRLYQESAPFNKKKAANRKKKKSMPPPQSTRRNIRRSTRTTNQPNEHHPQEEEQDDEDDEEWVPWKLVCMTVNDWQQFPQRYSKSIHPQDQQFHQLLIDDVLPKVIPVIEEHEKDRKKQEAILYRKRSSRILVRELEALEHHQAIVNDPSSEEPILSRSEQRRLQKEAEEKERQTKAREERILERERRVFEKAQAEERAAEKARLDRERRLQRRHGGDTDMDGDDVDIMTDHQDTSLLEQEQQQGFKLILTVGDPKKKSKKVDKKKKEIKDATLGKRKRGRKPKAQLQEDDESWTFNCTCGVFGKNIDDGTPMIACERCDEWQHIECLRKSGQVDSQLTSFDDLTFICRRCIEKQVKRDDTNMMDTKIQQAMPTPPDTYKQSSSTYTTTAPIITNNGSSYDFPIAHQHNPPLTTAYPPPVIQSSERHFLQQHQPHHPSPYVPSFIKPQLPYSELNGINKPSSSSSFDNGIIASHHHQQQQLPIMSISSEHQQYQHHQQRTLPSLPPPPPPQQQQQQHYSRPPIQLDPLRPSILSSPSSSAFQSITIPPPPPPPPPSTNTSMTSEAAHQTFPHTQ